MPQIPFWLGVTVPSVDPTAKARTLKQLASPLVISILKERMPIKTATPVVKSSEMQQTLHSDNLQVLHNSLMHAEQITVSVYRYLMKVIRDIIA